MEDSNLKCTNCGNLFRPSQAVLEEALKEFICPVCGSHEGSVVAEQNLQKTLPLYNLEKQLRLMLRKALTEGYLPEEVMEILKKELEFQAELSQVGHSFLIQIVDLGSHDTLIDAVPIRESRELFEQPGNNR